MASLAARLGIDVTTVDAGLAALLRAGQVSKRRGRFVVEAPLAINTSHDRELARKVKAVWTRTALERLEQGSAGTLGYNLFAISRHDLRRLRDLHLEYVRAMQELIARSQPSECVALYCSQLLDLAGEDNVCHSQRREGSTSDASDGTGAQQQLVARGCRRDAAPEKRCDPPYEIYLR